MQAEDEDTSSPTSRGTHWPGDGVGGRRARAERCCAGAVLKRTGLKLTALEVTAGAGLVGHAPGDDPPPGAVHAGGGRGPARRPGTAHRGHRVAAMIAPAHLWDFCGARRRPHYRSDPTRVGPRAPRLLEADGVQDDLTFSATVVREPSHARGLEAAMQERWKASLRERACLGPRSIVPVLYKLLAAQRQLPAMTSTDSSPFMVRSIGSVFWQKRSPRSR